VREVAGSNPVVPTIFSLPSAYPEMNPFESRFFRLLDSYAKSEHDCFFTEMFLNDDEREYVLCFRTLNRHTDREKPSACCYLEITVKDAMDSTHEKLLTQAIADEMRERLSELRK
jgi:hypothetical protein